MKMAMVVASNEWWWYSGERESGDGGQPWLKLVMTVVVGNELKHTKPIHKIKR